MDGKRYEKHVAKKMRRHGYIFVHVSGKSGDYGADVMARTLFLFRKVVVQCKHYKKPVGVEAVQEVIAARDYYGAKVAIVASNNTFTRNAKNLAKKCNVKLWERY